MRRFLPSASTPVIVEPTTRATCGPGKRARAPVTERPRRYGRSPAAVRARASPSGIRSRGRALERPAIRVAAPRPRDRGAVRVGRIGGGEQKDAAVARASRGVADGTEPIDRARQRELRRPESLDEVAAPDAARLLECAE